MFTRPDQVPQPLYVVTTVFNAMRYRSRWKLYLDFRKMVMEAGAKLLTVEVAFGQREFALNDEEHEYYLPLRTNHVLWHKERALNLGFARLPSSWQYAAHIDCDVRFARDDWANEIVHQLQHYKVLQVFSQSVDLSPSYDVLRSFRSFAYCVRKGVTKDKTGTYERKAAGIGAEEGLFHPGYGLAFRREAFERLGGLMDFAIMGGGDFWMVNCLFNTKVGLPGSLGPSGRQMLELWRQRANEYIKQDVGYLDSLILHYFHGKKKDRLYKERNKLLRKTEYDPVADLIPDSQGLWQLNPNNIQLRNVLREYMAGRNEDSIDV